MTQETVTRLALDQLRESPFNPRLTFDDAYLTELADSIRQQGILQPIVARPVSDDEHQFEIVFGHCRYRAARLAEHIDVPVIVRAMSDEEAAVAQIHENLKRKDVHPLEEALGYVRLMSDHHVKAGELIARTGKSKSYIYARLKLVTLGERARAAFLRGELDAETAVLVARYCPSEAQQHKALNLVTMPDPERGDEYRRPISHREAKRVLRDNFCIRINEAPFSADDAKLLKDRPACSACHKLAGNDPELADKSDADVCTDPACYRAKCQAHGERVLAHARKRGLQVLDGDEARKVLPTEWSAMPRDHERTSAVAFIERDASGAEVPVTFAQALQDMGREAPAPAPVVIVHPHKPGEVIEALPEDAVRAVLQHGREGARISDMMRWYVDDDEDDATGDDGDGPMTHARAVDQRPPEERAVSVPDHWVQVLRAILERVRSTPRTADELRLVLMCQLDLANEFGGIVENLLGWTAELEDADDPGAIRNAKLASMSPAELAELLVMTAIVDYAPPHGERAAYRLGLAKTYGVDVLQVTGLAAEGVDDNAAEAGLFDANAAA